MEDKSLCLKQNMKPDDAIQRLQDASNDDDVDSSSISDSCSTAATGKHTAPSNNECIEPMRKKCRTSENHQRIIQEYDSDSDNGCNIISSSNSTTNNNTDHDEVDDSDDQSDNDTDADESDDDDDDDEDLEDFVVVIDKLRDCIQSYQIELRSIRFENERNIRITSPIVLSSSTGNPSVTSVEVNKSLLRPYEAYQSFLHSRGKDGKLNFTDQLLHTYGYVI